MPRTSEDNKRVGHGVWREDESDIASLDLEGRMVLETVGQREGERPQLATGNGRARHRVNESRIFSRPVSDMTRLISAQEVGED